MSRLLHRKGEKKKKPRVRKKRDPLLIRPKRDWVLFFCIGMVLTILVIAVHGFIFFKVTTGDLFKAEVGATTEVRSVNREALSNVLNYFREREEALLEEIRNPSETPSVR